VVMDAQELVDQKLLKREDIRGPIRAGRVFGWYFLPKTADLGLPEMIVDLRQLHTVRLDLLTDLCRRGQRRARVQPLYREHLATHFADTYSRIGLPEPYPTDRAGPCRWRAGTPAHCHESERHHPRPPGVAVERLRHEAVQLRRPVRPLAPGAVGRR